MAIEEGEIRTDWTQKTLAVGDDQGNAVIIAGPGSAGATPWVVLADGRIHYPGGNVGIGTDVPAAELQVIGECRISGGVQSAGYTHFNYHVNGNNYIRGSTNICDTAQAEILSVGKFGGTYKLDVQGDFRTHRHGDDSQGMHSAFTAGSVSWRLRSSGSEWMLENAAGTLTLHDVANGDTALQVINGSLVLPDGVQVGTDANSKIRTYLSANRSTLALYGAEALNPWNLEAGTDGAFRLFAQQSYKQTVFSTNGDVSFSRAVNVSSGSISIGGWNGGLNSPVALEMGYYAPAARSLIRTYGAASGTGDIGIGANAHQSFCQLFLKASSSFIGVGTDSPSYSLHVAGNIYATGDIISASDIRRKAKIESITDPVGKVMQLQGFTYQQKHDKSETPRRMVGVSAQEVRKVLPEAVTEGSDGYLAVAYGNLSALLIEAVKEQQETIENLEHRLAEVEALLAI